MSSRNLGIGPVAAVGIGFVVAILAALSGGAGSLIRVLIIGFLVFAVVSVGWQSIREYRKQINKRAEDKQEAQQTAATQELQQIARQRKQRLVSELGSEYAALVESAEAAATRVADSEAARTGWLGDVDFTADIAAITDSLRKAHELDEVAQQLSTLAKPSAHDREILADARKTAANLAATATGRIKLIQKCADEAELVDHSLRQEREDARTSEQRAELHAKLSSMLYGIESAPSTGSENSPAADSVIARVQAYREVKNEMELVRGSATDFEPF